jgi:hypothetical protein
MHSFNSSAPLRLCVRNCLLAILSIPFAAGLAGCGSSLQPVRGTVMLPDGKPAAGSQVVFDGPIGGKAVSARGDVQPDGSFELSTSQPGDGVPLGKYRVQVNPPPLVNAEAAQRLPYSAKYTDFSTSELEYEVKPGSNEFPIQLTK